MIKNIVFDFNGTLVDDLDVSIDALNECIKEFHVDTPLVDKERYLEIFRFPVGPLYKELGFDFNKIDYNELANFFVKYYESRAFNECKLFDEVIPVLKDLKSKGFNLYILSASYINLLIEMLKKYAILEYFDGLVALDNNHGGSKIERGKQYFSEHKINPSTCVMIGDTIHDFEVATELGMSCISYDRGHNSHARLKSVNPHVISNLKDIVNHIN
jgi:phosphoglycolate phosphatase